MAKAQINFGEVGGGGAKVITKFFTSWAQGANETINYASEGLSQVDYVIAYGARTAANTYPAMYLWFSNTNSDGSTGHQYYDGGSNDHIPPTSSGTIAVGSTSQAVTSLINIISDTSGVLTLQNVCSYQANITNVTLIVGQFVHETS